jgi:glycosyltransferase involved in cell wall biosynthesis
MPRILMLIDQFYPVVGGAEQQALRVSLQLISRGYSVAVLTRQSTKELPFDEYHRGIRICRLPVSGNSMVAKLRAYWHGSKWLLRNRHKFDLIHCHGVNPLEWAVLPTCPLTRKPYIVKIPLSDFFSYAVTKEEFMSTDGRRRTTAFIRRMSSPALKRVRKQLLSKASSIIAISPEIHTRLTDRGFKNIVRIPNGVDTVEFAPVTNEEKLRLRRKLNLPIDGVIFIYAGRLAVEKNLETLLFAWRAFTEENAGPPAHLLILGDGEGQSYSTEQRLRRFAEDQRLVTVRFTKMVTNVNEYQQAGDVFVLPSRREGMSNALIEAMACGLPTIASDIAGNKAIIAENKTGLLFDPGSIESLKECLLRMVTGEKERRSMGREARRIASAKYSLNEIVDNIIEVYEKVLAENKKV